ncbi:MAG: hypothetical protein APF77_01530 [Clostridia bacterium BRH_c25]|nr:MAG: hypothetical protein APF77_01530 [Clostridia bacterium BRH_c25]
MLSQSLNPILSGWLNRPREIEWCITMGLDGKRRPNIKGTFLTSLAYIDDQGDKWGDTYVMIVGQHYEDYAHWNSVSTLLPIGGTHGTRNFVPSPFSKRNNKGAAPGVTGLIGEVLTTVFLQNVINLNPFDMAHIMGDRKAPDFCLDIEPRLLSNLFRTSTPERARSENEAIAGYLDSIVWDQPLPLECKSRREKGDRQVRNAMLQILEYWRRVPTMAGYGIFAQVDVNPITKLRIHLLIPKTTELDNIRRIINDLDILPEEPTVKEFNWQIGGKLFG